MDALIVVDVQNDFCPGGALAVTQGDAIVPTLNRYAALFSARGLPVFASRDWHPSVTSHFQAYGGIWPPHCVQETPGAALYPTLALPIETVLVSKGADPSLDAYSAFQALAADGTPFGDALRRLGVDRLFVGGLATDYCVKSTVLDALAEGFGATLLVDAVRGVNIGPHDSELAIEAMVRAGAAMATLEKLRLA